MQIAGGPELTEKEADFEPGTLLIDFLPFLQYLPLKLQPWHRRLAPLVGRESALHLAFLQTVRKAVEAGTAPDCFCKLLVEVSISSSHAYISYVTFS